MAPLAAPKMYVMSTRWVVSATSSGAATGSTGKLWSVWIVDNNTWIV